MNEIKEKINNCEICDISQLKVNITTENDKHFGKLFPKFCDEVYFFLVGLNPSRIRYKGSGLTVYGDDIEDGYYVHPFTNILKDIGIFDYCYITNLVKCSTKDNKVENKYCENCFDNHLINEINLIKPKAIIALGNQVFNFLISKKLDYTIYKIKHPSYYSSYKKGSKSEQINEIKSIILKEIQK